MSLTAAQIKHLCKLIDLHADAHREAAFAGTLIPKDADQVRADAALHKAKLAKFVNSLAEPAAKNRGKT